MLTGFFIGVLTSIVVAELYLWLPAASRVLNARAERSSPIQVRFSRLYRAAIRAPGTGVGVVLMAMFVGLERARRSFWIISTLRLGIEIALMVVAIWASFLLRYDGKFARTDLSVPLLVMVPLQWFALRIVGARHVWLVRSLRDLRVLVLGFLLSTLPLWMWAAIHPAGFTTLGIPRSVLIINVDLVIVLFVGVAMSRRILGDLQPPTPPQAFARI